MKTLQYLPNLDGRRFGVLTLGYDRSQEIRTEHAVLVALAAVVCDKAPEDLTIADVQAATARLQEQAVLPLPPAS